MSYFGSKVTLKDGPQLDAFSRLRVSSPITLFDSQQEYGLDTLRSWDCTANGVLPTILSPDGSVTSAGNAVGPRNVNTRMVPITVSTVSGHYAVLQSRQYTRYVPGKSHLILITGVFSPGTVANTDVRVGYFDAFNGCFLQITNGVASFVLRTSTSGSVDNTNTFSQANWNIDKMDGTGPSGITLDLSKTQILFIQAQWLGVGRVIVGFDIDGQLFPCHQFLNANNLTAPYTQTFNLPVRLEVRNTGTSAGATIHFVCCSVQSEGGEDVRGFPQSVNPGVATIGVTTRRPVFSIRSAATFHALVNRGHIDIDDYWLSAGTNSAIFEIVIGGTLTGASWLRVGNPQTAGTFIVGVRYTILTVGTTNFTLIGAASNTVGVSFVATGVGTGTGTATPENSIAEYDISATAITGGGTIVTGEVISGAGVSRGSADVQADFRNPIVLSQIDSLSAAQLPVSIVCTAVTGTSNIRAGMNWHEKVV